MSATAQRDAALCTREGWLVGVVEANEVNGVWWSLALADDSGACTQVAVATKLVEIASALVGQRVRTRAERGVVVEIVAVRS